MDRLGIDTNVLVRLWTNDDPVQVARIRARLAPMEGHADSVFINDITLCESVWVVGSAYRADKAGILAALQVLLDEPMFAFEDRATLQAAMQSFSSGKAGFVDCLILTRNRRLGCAVTLTFDKALARHDGAEWLGGTSG